MPSRRALVAIVAFWLVCQVWFVRREYLPRWLAAEAGPEFAVDLADEAAPRYSTWTIYRDDKKLGNLSSRMTFLPARDAFEIDSRFHNLEMTATVPFVGKLKAKAPVFASVSVVSRDGQLLSLKTDAKCEIELDSGSGIASAMPKLAFETSLNGAVVDGRFAGESELRTPYGNAKTPIEPFEVLKGNAFNPMQPQDRIAGLKPGRSWRMTRIDPVSDTFLRASLQSMGAMAKQQKAEVPELGSLLGSKKADELIAEVSAEPQALPWRGNSESCHVIEYRGDGVAGRTWVRVADGKVLQQEARGHGETLTLLRDN